MSFSDYAYRTIKCSILALVLLSPVLQAQNANDVPSWKKDLLAIYNLIFSDAGTAGKKLDSLRQAAEQKNDKERAAHYTEVRALMYYFQNDSAKAAQVFDKAENYFSAQHDYVSLGDYEFRKAFITMNKLKFKAAEKLFMSSLSWFEKAGDSVKQTTVHYRIADLYGFDNRHSDAVAEYTKGLTLAEKTGNKKQQWEGNLYLGRILLSYRQYAKGYTYYMKSMDIANEVKDSALYTTSAYHLAEYLQTKHQYKEALDYARKAYGFLSRQSGGLRSNIYALMGNLLLSVGQPDSAMRFASRFLEFSEEQQNKTAILDAHVLQGEIYSEKKDYANAFREYQSCLPLIKELGTTMSSALAYKGLAETEFRLNQPVAAYEHLMSYVALNDSIFKAESQRQMAEAEAQFQNEKKQHEIENLNRDKALKDEEIKKQNIRNIALGSGLALTLVFSFITWKSYRRKQKANRIIQQQRDHMEMQKLIVEQKNQEIVDSINYARRIQRSLLPTDQYIERHLALKDKKNIDQATSGKQ